MALGAAGKRREEGLVHAKDSAGRDYVHYQGTGQAGKATRGMWADPVRVRVDDEASAERAATTVVRLTTRPAWGRWAIAVGMGVGVVCIGVVAIRSRSAPSQEVQRGASATMPPASIGTVSAPREGEERRGESGREITGSGVAAADASSPAASAVEAKPMQVPRARASGGAVSPAKSAREAGAGAKGDGRGVQGIRQEY
jgi:hypothetical protein